MKHLIAFSLVAWFAAGAVAADLEPTLGSKGRLLAEEVFGGGLSSAWSVKSGNVRAADGLLRAERGDAARLCLFSYAQPFQDAVVQLDFRFDGGGGINVGVNPEAGELRKKGHLFSVMITPSSWNITEHNDKSDRTSQCIAQASAVTRFEQGRWYTLTVEWKGDDVVARVEGKEPLRASSPDFRVRKPGLEFRMAGRGSGAVSFDNVRVWELK